MTDQEIKDELLKAIELFQDKTWTTEDLGARFMQILKESNMRERWESYIWQVMEMQRLHEKYFGGDKSVIGKCKGVEANVRKLSVENLKRMGITNIEVFMKKYQQGSLF